MSEDQVGYRADIDGLRAIAVLSVVFFHAFPKYLPGGFVGVDIFFVISGYLISGIILRSLHLSRFTYWDFYSRRIRRIFPALLAVLTAALLAGWFLLLPDEYRALGKQIVAGAGFSSNLLLWREAGFFGYFDISAQVNPLLHLWSLGVEEQFYLSWPLILAFFYRRSHHLNWTIALLLLASFALNLLIVDRWPIAAFYCPLSRFWELLLGAALAHATLLQGDTQRIAAGWRREGIAWGGAALFAISLVLITQKSTFPGWWAVVPSLGALALIVARDAWFNRNVLSNRILVFLGLISYPLYLWHWVILAIIRARLPLDGGEAPRVQRVAAVLLSLLLAWLTYELIEKPIRFRKRRAWQPAALLGLMALVGGLGAAALLSNGAAFRLPPSLRSLAATDYALERNRVSGMYRGGRCFLGPNQSFADLAPQCIEQREPTKPLVVLWGDSHAASLYPGLKALQGEGDSFRIDQFTAAACPPGDASTPLLQLDQRCATFDHDVLTKVLALHPDIVVIEGDWWLYYTQGAAYSGFIPALQSAVQKLKSGGVGRVVVFGNLPVWDFAQPRVIERLWRDSGTLVTRTHTYFAKDATTADAQVQKAVSGLDVNFFSPIKQFCDDAGCLLSVTQTEMIPVAWDSAHLTPEASKVLIDATLRPLQHAPRYGYARFATDFVISRRRCRRAMSFLPSAIPGSSK